VEPDRQGRVFGLVGIVMAVATPVGMLLLGPLADALPIEAILVGTGLLTFLVIGIAVWSPAGRRAVAAVHATPRTAEPVAPAEPDGEVAPGAGG
jgi:DHA3 family macrolide efflux protein-like MFS transporter